ncbi:transposase [Methyloprofundus sp.]|uniref:transposase n=1 Tax=Methyloprofundus sp. TaxID=2020875 RepID=UPI003D09661F
MNKKTLNHYSQLNVYQFVTFRTHDSVDEYLHRVNQTPDLSISQKQMNIDSYCDRSNKGCYLKGDVITIIDSYLKQLDPEFYRLIAYSIMPNHLHLLFQQNQQLKEIMKRIKGGSALLVNKYLARHGKLWERDYFDKAIRDEIHFLLTYEYIKNNAIKAKLEDADQRFYGIYEN